MLIEVEPNLRPRIEGTPITTAFSVRTLHKIMGPPSRVHDSGEAPVKHRNNQIHVYDSLGIYFYEHHYTRLIDGCNIIFRPDLHGFGFTPHEAFSGQLTLAGLVTSLQPKLIEFLRICPIQFKRIIGGFSQANCDDFSVSIGAQGRKLRSGKKSKVLNLVELSLSWPHDPWTKPQADS